jgi:hypothetical protein
MAYQVIKQALVWTKQETQLSYKIENRIIAGYLGNTVKLTQLGRGDFTCPHKSLFDYLIGHPVHFPVR